MDVVETPHRRARQRWDARMGTLRQQRTLWQAATLGATVVAGLLAFGLIQAWTRPQAEIYVLEQQAGAEPRLVKMGDLRWSPKQAHLAEVAKRFITVLRRVPTDRVLYGQDWEWAQNVVSKKGENLLKAYIGEFVPAKAIGDRVVQVEILRCLPNNQDKGSSYDLTWVETELTTEMMVKEKRRYSGIVTLQFRHPKDAREAQRNPLGIWVEYFTWGENNG